jgi:hypothetical protein
MSNNTEFNNPKNSNEWIKWIEETDSSDNFIFYEYKYFSNIQKIGSTKIFGKIYRANWKNSHEYLTLKSFYDLNKTTIKEIVREVIIEY